jgi:hypothetical protein
MAAAKIIGRTFLIISLESDRIIRSAETAKIKQIAELRVIGSHCGTRLFKRLMFSSQPITSSTLKTSTINIDIDIAIFLVRENSDGNNFSLCIRSEE